MAMLNARYIAELEEYLSSGDLAEDFKWSVEERRGEILEFLEKLMDLGELADATATTITWQNALPRHLPRPVLPWNCLSADIFQYFSKENAAYPMWTAAFSYSCRCVSPADILRGCRSGNRPAECGAPRHGSGFVRHRAGLPVLPAP